MQAFSSAVALPEPGAVPAVAPAAGEYDGLLRVAEGWPPLLRRLRHDRLALLGVGLITLFFVVAVAAPLLAPYDPTAVNALQRLQGPSAHHALGTDHLGRDLLSRLLYGSRWSLSAVTVAIAAIMLIGVSVGVIAGFYGGLLDDVLMRVVDVLLALPSLVLALAIAGMLGPGITSVMIGLVSVWWVTYARVVRGMVLTLRERHFIESARGLGARDRRIILRHVLPNVLPSVVILATLELGELILAVSGLSFLGLGAQPPTPEWGAMLNDGRPFLLSAPQLMIYPGLAISAVVVGFNLVGDGLRDLLDPHLLPGG